MGTDWILWPGCVTCGLLAVSGYAQMARAKGGWREKAAWTAPLLFTSAALMLLVVFGALALLPWLVLALVPLAVVAARAARAWREIAKLKGPWAATAAVLSLLASRIRNALWNAREDVRDLAGILHREAVPAGQAPPAAGVPPLAALRAVPSVREAGNLGAVPAPAEVAADLTAAGVAVPEPFRALAEWMAGFEPENQEDFEGHAAEEAAGWLTLAGAKEAQAETLLNVPKLHPDVVAAQLEVADGSAELAALAAMGIRRYHERYGDVEDWHEDGSRLPEDARNWFGDGAGAA